MDTFKVSNYANCTAVTSTMVSYQPPDLSYIQHRLEGAGIYIYIFFFRNNGKQQWEIGKHSFDESGTQPKIIIESHVDQNMYL